MYAKQYILVALIALAFLATNSVQADWEDRFGQAKVVHLSDILEDPDSWLEVVVRIPLRFEGIRQFYTPFYTFFDRETHLNFSGWDVNAPIWEKDGFASDYPRFYVDKRNKELKTFLKLQKFETISVLGKVEAIFKGKPYFRIVYVCRMEGNLNVHNLTLLNRGMQAFKDRKFDESLEYFTKVMKTNPPEDIKALLHKHGAKIYLYEKKDYTTALQQLDKGLSLAKNDVELREMRAQCDYYLKHGGPAPRPLNINPRPVKVPVSEEKQQKSEVVQQDTYIESTPIETINEPVNVVNDTATIDETKIQDTPVGDGEVIEYWEEEQ